MSAPSNTSNTSEWVKWGIGIAILLGGGAFGSALRYENRITTVETTQVTQKTAFDTHVQDAKEAKTEVNRRLTGVEAGNQQVLEKLGEVKEDVAAIRGALSIPKSANRR